MKKILLVVPAFLIFVSCHNYQSDIDKLQAEKTSLSDAAKYKDSTITSFISEVNEIESNLAQIEIKQKQSDLAVASSGSELKGNQAERIKENIKAIDALMKENKVRIAALNQKLKASGIKIADFEKMVANLNQQMEGKDKELAELNVKLASLNTRVDSLNTQVTGLTADNTEKTKVIDDQTMKLHTAYFTTGTAKELVDKKVLVKEGGFLGLGKSEKMMSNYDNSAFSQIDITKTSTIPIEAKDAKIVTTHPTDSYTIQHAGKDQISSLVITDPDKFWKTSKYLVVVVEK
jgi:predicted  nucleic acid-binding Zn-ribbon protein